MSAEEQRGWGKLVKECLDEHPRLKSGVHFWEGLSFGTLLLMGIGIMIGAPFVVLMGALPAIAAYLDRKLWRDIKMCVREKKKLPQMSPEEYKDGEGDDKETNKTDSIKESKMKEKILNEINEMRYMFKYNRGVVISEQKIIKENQVNSGQTQTPQKQENTQELQLSEDFIFLMDFLNKSRQISFRNDGKFGLTIFVGKMGEGRGDINGGTSLQQLTGKMTNNNWFNSVVTYSQKYLNKTPQSVVVGGERFGG
jgi:hypothetical protein